MFIEKLRKKNNKSKIEAKPAYEELNPKATTTTTNSSQHISMHLTRNYLIEKKLIECSKTSKLHHLHIRHHHHHHHHHHNQQSGKDYISKLTFFCSLSLSLLRCFNENQK